MAITLPPMTFVDLALLATRGITTKILGMLGTGTVNVNANGMVSSPSILPAGLGIGIVIGTATATGSTDVLTSGVEAPLSEDSTEIMTETAEGMMTGLGILVVPHLINVITNRGIPLHPALPMKVV